MPLAEYRYGREEMLSLLLDDPPLLQDLAKIPMLCHPQALKPLSLMPLTEIEQVRGMAGQVRLGSAQSHAV